MKKTKVIRSRKRPRHLRSGGLSGGLAKISGWKGANKKVARGGK